MSDEIEIERDERGRVRHKERNRASRLRTKASKGRELDDSDRAWLAAYDATVAEIAAARSADAAAAQGDDADPAAAEPETVGGGAGVELGPDDAAPAEPPPAAARTPKPPKVAQLGAAPPPAGASSGRTRPPPKVDMSGGVASSGREQAVEILSGIWLSTLDRMAADLRAVGLAPMIDPAALAPAIVDTVRRNLPAQAEATPEMIAGIGSSLILFQRWRARTAIAQAADAARPRPTAPVYGQQAAEPPPPVTPAETVEPADPDVPAEPPPAPPAPSAEPTNGARTFAAPPGGWF